MQANEKALLRKIKRQLPKIRREAQIDDRKLYLLVEHDERIKKLMAELDDAAVREG